MEQPSATSPLLMTTAGTQWGAVACMSLLTFVLIASEFMPVSLLTPIARDLGISEGQAGQAIAVSGFFAIAPHDGYEFRMRNFVKSRAAFLFGDVAAADDTPFDFLHESISEF